MREIHSPKRGALVAAAFAVLLGAGCEGVANGYGAGGGSSDCAIPSNAIPSNAIPSNAIPSNVDDAIPSSAIPSNSACLDDPGFQSGFDCALPAQGTGALPAQGTGALPAQAVEALPAQGVEVRPAMDWVNSCDYAELETDQVDDQCVIDRSASAPGGIAETIICEGPPIYVN